MSLETSIDALVRDFEIEDVRDEGKTQEKPQLASEAQQVTPTPPVAAQDPMSFLDDALVNTVPDAQESDEDDEPSGPSVAEMKQKAKEDHKQIVALEKEVKLQRYDLEDRAYMKAQLKALISDNRAVLDCIESQLKIGTNPHLFEVYGNLSKTVSDNIMRLAKIDQMVTDYKIVEDKGTGNIKHDVMKDQMEAAAAAGQNMQGAQITQINNTFNFASDELLKLVKSAMPPVQKVKEEDLPKFKLE